MKSFRLLSYIFLFLVFSTPAFSQSTGSIKGEISYEGEPTPFIKVTLENSQFGAMSDIDGLFQLNNIPVGNYTLVLESYEFRIVRIEDVEVRAGQTTSIDHEYDDIQQPIQTLKPILYFYPDSVQDIHVQLNYAGNLTTTYPKYQKNGWNVTAHPNSTLVDSIGRNYYSLYWEGTPDIPLGIEKGNVVSKDETISFLEENLAILGLTEREANEFIIFWLPELEKSPHNIISFSTEEYEQQAQLIILPEPETVIRVMMVYQPLDAPIEIPIQDINELKRTRQGFTVVEWGGQKGQYTLSFN